MPEMGQLAAGLPLPIGIEDHGLDFREFFEAEYERLGRALFVLTGSRTEAEDLTQEALVRVYERWDRVRSMDSPTGYLYRTAMNLHRSRLRRLRSWATRATATDPVAADPLAHVHDRDQVARLLASLPVAQRQAVILVELIGMSSEEAARILRIEPVSVRVRLSRARSVLRRTAVERDA
jgi:RNA polymerase sigma-70 factor (ECF subfamily)